jgi:membrane peptidoglycan carboxypeptidase
METNGFRITHFGEADPRVLNGPFTYTFYERGKAVRSIRVGSENPSFTPVHALPNALKQAVLAAEDPNFHGHNGFEPEAIRNAIAANYLAGRFRRGGSTLSMQLVKNVFLSRRKTLARKIEEVLLVWMMEQQQLIPKERLFEVYLNVIEWGPGVLGIGEAAHWYFGKPASQVTEEEAVWLASIIPSPKRFASWFDADGNLVRSDLHLRVVWQVMQNRGIALPADTTQTLPRVRISGAARSYLRAQPTFADSTANTETETWEE